MPILQLRRATRPASIKGFTAMMGLRHRGSHPPTAQCVANPTPSTLSNQG
jgi:hypothetical protein